MILIDNYESAFELLWDVSISILIIRPALLYFCLTFFTGCVLGYIRVKMIIPIYHLSEPVAELLEMPLMLLAIFIWARFITVRYSVPNVAGMRLAIGFLALGFMLLTEFVGRFLTHEEGFRGRIWDMNRIADGIFAVALLLFGLMPRLLMVVRKPKVVIVLEPLRQENKPSAPGDSNGASS